MKTRWNHKETQRSRKIASIIKGNERGGKTSKKNKMVVLTVLYAWGARRPKVIHYCREGSGVNLRNMIRII